MAYPDSRNTSFPQPPAGVVSRRNDHVAYKHVRRILRQLFENPANPLLRASFFFLRKYGEAKSSVAERTNCRNWFPVRQSKAQDPRLNATPTEIGQKAGKPRVMAAAKITR